MSEPLKVGDVVVLKSGGPRMTIDHLDAGPDGSFISCKWFDKQDVIG